MNSSGPIGILNNKLKRVKKYLKGWGADRFVHARKSRKEIYVELGVIDELEELPSLDADMHCRRAALNTELFDLLAEEEIFWLQQTNEKWSLQGDRKTAFYHRVANGRKRKNTIHSLEDGDVVIEGTSMLLEHAIAFYSNLFGPTPGHVFQLSPNTWDTSKKTIS